VKALLKIRFESSDELSFSSDHPYFIVPINKNAFLLQILSIKHDLFSNEIMLIPKSNSVKIRPIDLYGSFAIFVLLPTAIKQLGENCKDLNLSLFKKMLVTTQKINLKNWEQECLFRYLFELTTDKYHVNGIKKILEIEILKELYFSILDKNMIHPKDEFYPSTSQIRQMPIQLQKGIEFIERNPVDKLSVQKLCSFSGASPSTFLRMFKKYLNTTPQDFILKRKMIFSKELLFQKNKSILEISELLGFSHPSAFIYSFKKYFKQTPNQFRLKITE